MSGALLGAILSLGGLPNIGTGGLGVVAVMEAIVGAGAGMPAGGSGGCVVSGTNVAPRSANCLESWDHIPIRSWPLFKARHVLRTLLLHDNQQLNS